MVCAALLARLPTPWTAVGAVCFAVSDAMIGIGEFVRRSGAGGADLVGLRHRMVLITAGFFFGGPLVGPLCYTCGVTTSGRRPSTNRSPGCCRC